MAVTARKRGIRALLLSAVGAAFLTLLSGCAAMEKEMNDFVTNGVIVTPDLTKINDGQYQGKYKSGIVSATVRVEVRDHGVTAIDILKHFNGQGKPIIEI